MRFILRLILLYCISCLSFIALKYYTNCDNPIITIISPPNIKGYLAINNCNNLLKYNINDIIIYKQPNYHNLFIRKITEINDDSILTKSDDNINHDKKLYYNNEIYLKKEYIIGRLYRFIPFIGYLKILFDNYLLYKYIIFILYSLFSIFIILKQIRSILLRFINIVFDIIIYYIFLLNFSNIGVS